VKRKTINAILAKKFNEFCESIEDDDVQDLVRNNSIITGGCIASMLLGEKVNDFDIYFTNYETVYAVAKYYTRGHAHEDVYVQATGERVRIIVQSAGVANGDGIDEGYRYFEQDVDPHTTEAGDYAEEVLQGMTDEMNDEKKPYSVVFLSENAITLRNKVQLIIRFYGDADQIHENYDFVHCTNYWTPKDKLVLHSEALEALLARELKYVGSLYPICSMIRTRKFLNRGFTINAGQYLKMAMQISALDLSNVSVLRDQLTGVDVHYFMEVLKLLEKKTEGGKPIDATYLVEIIDRMF